MLKFYKKMIFASVVLLLAFVTSSCSGNTDTADSFEYEYSDDLGGAVLTKYIGENTDVKIPSKIENHPVVGIDGAFSGAKLVSVTIPNSVTSIGYRSFIGCSSLKSVKIPNSVTVIGRAAFEGCSSLESITIPNGVTRIEDWAFADCPSLVSITIPKNITGIGDTSFAGCSSFSEESKQKIVQVNPNARFD